MAASYSAWLSTLKASRRGYVEGNFGRPSERQLHVTKIDELIAFVERCEKNPQAIAIVLGLSNGGPS